MNKRKRVVFRADGNSEMGLGHVYRSLALAQMLKENFELLFITVDPLQEVREMILETCDECIELEEDRSKSTEVADVSDILGSDNIVVLDGYHFDGEYQRQLREHCYKVVSIDDMHQGHFYSDVIINHCGKLSEDIYSREPYTEVLLGEKYALLRPEFLQAARDNDRNREIEQKKLFVSMGGSDYQNITQKVVEATKDLDSFLEINIVLGAANMSKGKITNLVSRDERFNIFQNLSASGMCNLMEKSDLAVAPASSISFEVCAVGMGFISGYYTKNQHDLVNWLNETNCASIVGNFTKIGKHELQKVLSAQNEESIRSMIANQKIIDGQSGYRLNKFFSDL